jgi:hypothetical protein
VLLIDPQSDSDSGQSLPVGSAPFELRPLE